MAALAQSERNAILRQIYEVADAGRNFAYAHLRPDGDMAIYSGFGTPELAAALIRQSQGKSPLPYPESLIFYRQAFHQHLATDTEFLQTLAQRGANRRRYFREMEKAVQICFREMLALGDDAPTLPPARIYSTATTHARDLTRLYFRSVSLALTMLRLMYREEDSENREFMEQLYGSLWAVDLASAYVASLLNIDFHPAQLIESGQAPGAERYTTRALTLTFNAGLHIARRMAKEVFPQIPRLQANYSQLTHILSEEMAQIGKLQRERDFLEDANSIEATQALISDALSQYKEDVLHNLTLKCAERRLNQERSNRAMQQALAGKPSPAHYVPYVKEEEEIEEEEEAIEEDHIEEEEIPRRERDLEQEKQAAPQSTPAPQAQNAPSAKAQATAIMTGLAAMGTHMGEQTSRTVINEGHKIIEYLRRLQLGEATSQQAEGMEAGVAAGATDDSSSGSGSKKEEHSLNLEDMEFDVRVDGEEKRKRTLREILSALMSGKHVTFASKAQALTFTKACMALMKNKLPFQPSQIRFINKGRIQELTHEILQEMAIEFELQTHMLRAEKKHSPAHHHEKVGDYVEKSHQRHQADDHAHAALKDVEKAEKQHKHADAPPKEAPETKRTR